MIERFNRVLPAPPKPNCTYIDDDGKRFRMLPSGELESLEIEEAMDAVEGMDEVEDAIWQFASRGIGDTICFPALIRFLQSRFRRRRIKTKGIFLVDTGEAYLLTYGLSERIFSWLNTLYEFKVNCGNLNPHFGYFLLDYPEEEGVYNLGRGVKVFHDPERAGPLYFIGDEIKDCWWAGEEFHFPRNSYETDDFVVFRSSSPYEKHD